MNPEQQRIELARKPKKCPACGTSPVASIQYGMPAMDMKLQQKIDEGRVTLGGCVISGDDPAWECTQCGRKIYRRKAN